MSLARLRLFRGAVHPHPNPLPRGRGDFCFLRVRFCPYRYPRGVVERRDEVAVGLALLRVLLGGGSPSPSPSRERGFLFLACSILSIPLPSLLGGGTGWRLVWLFCGCFAGRFTLTLTLSLEGEGIFVSCVFDFVPTVTLIAGWRGVRSVGWWVSLLGFSFRGRRPLIPLSVWR